MRATPFSHLHVHSHYSLLEALPKLSVLVEAAKKDGQTALALTDNGNLYGAVEFYKECKDAGIKPIIGVDFYVAPRTRHDKEHRVDDRHSRLILLAQNFAGYQNLLQLVSRSYIEGFYYRPRIDRELIEEYTEGLIAILPSFSGEHARAIDDGNITRAKELLAWYKKTFPDRVFLEITHHPEVDGHAKKMRKILELARSEHVEPVAAHDVYYMEPEDRVARELVIKIRTGGTLDREAAETGPDFSFISSEKAVELFADTPEAIDNTQKIADMCDLKLDLGKAIFPTFPIPQGSTDNAELRALTEKGIQERGLADTKELRDRIDYELKIIEQKGYASYFLIVADLLSWARRAGIYTNTRGSAAGSMVSYLCGITTVDPMEFNMPFERFLNPERPSAPDIDMDIADNRRDELIEYARKKYGADHVVQIGTFGTMMARAAVRDVARALGHPYALGDQIAKTIPFGKQGFPVSIDGSLKDVPELKDMYDNDAEAREVLDLARKIEGNARHVGVHAAGVVIAPEAVSKFSPIQPDPKGGKTITQYDMYSICDEYGGVGLLKFDFLGLTNLSVLADSVQRVSERLGIHVDLDRIPLDDQKVYDMLSRGETLGVFQMAGSGMTAYLKDLKPTVVYDLNAMVALYRPGPMAFIPEYIERKKNPAKVRYLDPRMESILKPTYGILIYQDDVMMIAVQLAGYSWGEADKFRKAMGKKIPAEMAAQKERFISGCLEHGMKPIASQHLWEQIETFAAYGFNKCVPADTRIWRKKSDGTIEDVALLHIAAGDVVASLNQETRRIEWQRVEHKTAMGKKPLLCLKTDTKSIRATSNHPFLVKDPPPEAPVAYPSPVDGAAWIDAGHLKTGMYVAARKPRLGIFIDDANTFYAQRKNGWRINYKRLSRLLEHVYDIQFINCHIVMPSAEDDAYDKSAAHIAAIKARYGNLITIKEKRLKYIWNADTRTHIRKGNVDGEIMLEAIASADELDAVAIVTGDSDYRILADTLHTKGKECFFIGYENTMAWELRQVRHLYANRFREFLEALPPDKQKAPAEAGVPLLLDALYSRGEYVSSNGDFVWAKVTSIEQAEKEEVWDIGVRETHSFIAEGLIVHNSHAASYGNLAYKTAYMKANFPVDYMAAVLTADAGDVEKIAETVAECNRIGIKVWPPSVNESGGNFTVIDEKNIRFGLYSIKNFGTGVGDSIVSEREANGAFADMADFLTRIPDKNLNKKSLEALVMSGALDEYGERGQLAANIENFLSYHREHMKAPSNQSSLFGALSTSKMPLKLSSAPAATLDQKLAWEKELLGLYISGHPLDKHKDKLKNQKTTIKHAKENLKGVETVIAGFVETLQPILTKKGEKMAFLKLADFSGDIEVVAFPRVLKENETVLSPGTCVMLKGRISDRNGIPSFVAEKARAL